MPALSRGSTSQGGQVTSAADKVMSALAAGEPLDDDHLAVAALRGTIRGMDELADEAAYLIPTPALSLLGNERFVGLDASVLDFWRWAFSDLRDNTTRGILAEFLVARAVGDDRGIRVGWDNFDAVAQDGTQIEVKCSAFLQSWPQKRPSDLVFGRLTSREWNARLNEYADARTVHADVFVFAVQMQTEPSDYNMLDLRDWSFWVIGREGLEAEAVRSVGIAWVKRNATGPIPYDKLASTIRSMVTARH